MIDLKELALQNLEGLRAIGRKYIIKAELFDSMSLTDYSTYPATRGIVKELVEMGLIEDLGVLSRNEVPKEIIERRPRFTRGNVYKIMHPKEKKLADESIDITYNPTANGFVLTAEYRNIPEKTAHFVRDVLWAETGPLKVSISQQDDTPNYTLKIEYTIPIDNFMYVHKKDEICAVFKKAINDVRRVVADKTKVFGTAERCMKELLEE